MLAFHLQSGSKGTDMRPTLLIMSALLIGCSEYDIRSNQDTPGAPGDSDDDINGGEGNYDPDAPNGGVSGRICAPSQNVYVADAEVYIEFEDGTRLSTQTDADGYFTLEGVPVGTYTVHVEKGSFGATFDVTITEGTITELAQDECLEGDIEIAVVTGSYDDVGGILTRLGLSYDAYDGDPYGSREYEELLSNPSRLAQYDIIFFNCGMDDTWAYGFGGISLNEIRQNLREFVQDGGSIYASDWAYYMIEAPFPSLITFAGDDSSYSSAAVGESGYYTVNVLDPGLRTLLGSNTASINYDLPSWVVPASTSSGEILVRGSVLFYENWTSLVTKDVPLVISGSDNGRILYTSFHNETQTTVDMDRMLEQMALDL